MNRQEIGLKIKELRMKRCLSLRQLEEMTGYSHSNIIRIEAGKYSVGVDIICKILDTLGADIEIVDKPSSPYNTKIKFNGKNKKIIKGLYSKCNKVFLDEPQNTIYIKVDNKVYIVEFESKEEYNLFIKEI